MSRELRNKISLILISFVSLVAAFSTADDFFHSAAQQYVFGKKQEAKATIAEGLQKFPNDAKLIALGKLIKDDQNQQNQNKNNQDQNKDKNQDQNEQDQNNQDQKKQDQNKQEQNKDQNAKNDKQKQQEQQPQPQPQDKKEDLQKKEAERIIMQFADDADSLNKPPKKEGLGIKLRKPEKDW